MKVILGCYAVDIVLKTLITAYTQPLVVEDDKQDASSGFSRKELKESGGGCLEYIPLIYSSSINKQRTISAI